MWNEIPPAPFFNGGETPGSSYAPFSKGGWGDLGSDLLGSRLWRAAPSYRQWRALWEWLPAVAAGAAMAESAPATIIAVRRGGLPQKKLDFSGR